MRNLIIPWENIGNLEKIKKNKKDNIGKTKLSHSIFSLYQLTGFNPLSTLSLLISLNISLIFSSASDG
jgi:hypothetical protein